MGSNRELEMVIGLDEALRHALETRDLETVERLYAPEFTLNSPSLKIQSRQETIELLRTTPLRQVGLERTIEVAYSSGGVVVLMGAESFTWEGTGTELDGSPHRPPVHERVATIEGWLAAHRSAGAYHSGGRLTGS